MSYRGISDDYAVMDSGDWRFYYGYEVTNEIGSDWMFQVTRKGKHVATYSVEFLGMKHNDNPEDVLLAGIARFLSECEIITPF